VPDLVVLDLNLPRKDGCEVLANIKADPALAKIPVVIFTTSQANSDIDPQLQTGSELLSAKAGKSSGIRRRGSIHGRVLAGLCQPAAEGETMKDQSTHVY
jgi:CheY-like chemotaxis protein